MTTSIANVTPVRTRRTEVVGVSPRRPTPRGRTAESRDGSIGRSSLAETRFERGRTRSSCSPTARLISVE